MEWLTLHPSDSRQTSLENQRLFGLHKWKTTSPGGHMRSALTYLTRNLCLRVLWPSTVRWATTRICVSLKWLSPAVVGMGYLWIPILKSIVGDLNLSWEHCCELLQVGVDVEERDRKLSRNLMALARRRFSPEEVDWLARFEDATEQQQRFMQLWTLKVMLTSLTLVIKGILCVVYMVIWSCWGHALGVYRFSSLFQSNSKEIFYVDDSPAFMELSFTELNIKLYYFIQLNTTQLYFVLSWALYNWTNAFVIMELHYDKCRRLMSKLWARASAKLLWRILASHWGHRFMRNHAWNELWTVLLIHRFDVLP